MAGLILHHSLDQINCPQSENKGFYAPLPHKTAGLWDNEILTTSKDTQHCPETFSMPSASVPAIASIPVTFSSFPKAFPMGYGHGDLPQFHQRSRGCHRHWSGDRARTRSGQGADGVKWAEICRASRSVRSGPEFSSSPPARAQISQFAARSGVPGAATCKIQPDNFTK